MAKLPLLTLRSNSIRAVFGRQSGKNRGRPSRIETSRFLGAGFLRDTVPRAATNRNEWPSRRGAARRAERSAKSCTAIYLLVSSPRVVGHRARQSLLTRTLKSASRVMIADGWRTFLANGKERERERRKSVLPPVEELLYGLPNRSIDR